MISAFLVTPKKTCRELSMIWRSIANQTSSKLTLQKQRSRCSIAVDFQLAHLHLMNNPSKLSTTSHISDSTSQHNYLLHSMQRTSTQKHVQSPLLFTKLPLLDLPLNLVVELFSIFIMPIYMYGLPLWISNCSSSSLQMINATFTKFLKRYLLIPTHSNNACTYFLTSTIPLSTHLKRIAPNAIGSLSFPPILHGIRLSFLPEPSQSINASEDFEEILQAIPSQFWLSKVPSAIPMNRRNRRHLLREIFDSDHDKVCQSSSFHPHPLPTCLCIHCGKEAHYYHTRFCQPL